MRAALKVGVAGLGAVGLPVARALDAHIPGLVLGAVSANDMERARARVESFRDRSVPIVPVAELPMSCDVVVEALPPSRFMHVAKPTLLAGKTLVAATVTQLLANEQELLTLANDSGGRIIVPAGALVGLDAVRAAAEGTLHSVVMRTRKPPAGLINAPFVKEQGIDLHGLQEARCLFAGDVRSAAQKFPANVNVAVALAMAGPGVDRTQYEVWADPGVTRNTHTIVVEADSTRFEITVAGVPTESNPATGKLTPLSVIATLRGMTAAIRVGA